MRRPELTPKQEAVYEYIRWCIHHQRIPPSLDEIRIQFGAKQRAHVYGFLLALEKKGYIVRNKGKQRTITLVEDIYPTRAFKYAGDLEGGVLRPVTGEEKIDFGEWFDIPGIECYRVKGSFLIVRKHKIVNAGDNVLCRIGDVTTVVEVRNVGEGGQMDKKFFSAGEEVIPREILGIAVAWINPLEISE